MRVLQPPARGTAQEKWRRDQPPYRTGGAIRFLVNPRRQHHAAAVVALAAVLVLAFLAHPVRRFVVSVDGVERTIAVRAASERHALESAGIDLHAADELDVQGSSITVVRATEALIEVDGRALSLRTQALTIAGALLEAGVVLDPRDSVLQNSVFVSPAAPLVPQPIAVSAKPSGSRSAPVASVSIEVRRAVQFEVAEDGQRIPFESSRPTVGLALKEMGVRLGPGDLVVPSTDSELTAGLEITVRHATPITVALPSGRRVVYTLRDTVGEALDEAGIELPAGDDVRVEPTLDSSVRPDMAVHIILLSNELSMEQEFVESQTVFEPDPSLPFGRARIVEGNDGVRYRQYSVNYENGVETSRELVAEWFDPEPRDTIVYYSPAVAPQALASGGAPADARGGPPPEGARIAQTLRVYATWYNPASAGRAPTDPYYGITATGVPVTYGVIAVDPNIIPLGTKLYVPGYGYGVAADTGGAVVGHLIDLGYPDGVTPDFVPGWVDIYILAD